MVVKCRVRVWSVKITYDIWRGHKAVSWKRTGNSRNFHFPTLLYNQIQVTSVPPRIVLPYLFVQMKTAVTK